MSGFTDLMLEAGFDDPEKYMEYLQSKANFDHTERYENTKDIPKSESKDISYYLIEADQEMANGNYNEAIEAYEAIIYLHDDTCLEAYLGMGEAHYLLKEYQIAEEDYSFAINISPTCAKAYFWRGKIQCALIDYKRAVADFTQAINIDSKYSDAYFDRGGVKFQLHDYLGAIEDYTKVIELNSQDSLALRYRGKAKIACGQNDSGNADLNTAAELDFIWSPD